ncbi:MAG: hypothetical protein BMS9Abin29_1753 [Gemmatimonadota bacterium]|nr:MAG: hypothetical protein BMS9Abin29_1753 [Gemmatimonadota bacterium]
MTTPAPAGWDRRRAILVLVAFVAGAAAPIQLITLSFGYAEYVKGIALPGPQLLSVAHEFARFYIPFVWIPALVALTAVGWYTRRAYPDIFRRIVVGFGMGAVATLALDAVRQAGVLNGWLPGDTVVMFGKMASASPDFWTYWPVGLLVHYLNGAGFGLFYAFVWGKRPNYRSALLWATGWLLVVELGMMTLPPMGPALGLFGFNFAWPQFFILTLVAHVFFGVALGLLVQHFLTNEDRGGFFALLRRRAAG